MQGMAAVRCGVFHVGASVLWLGSMVASPGHIIIGEVIEGAT